MSFLSLLFNQTDPKCLNGNIYVEYIDFFFFLSSQIKFRKEQVLFSFTSYHYNITCTDITQCVLIQYNIWPSHKLFEKEFWMHVGHEKLAWNANSNCIACGWLKIFEIWFIVQTNKVVRISLIILVKQFCECFNQF